MVEIAYILPHVHEGGHSIELQDAVTNETLCYASRENGGIIYGNGTEPGDEAGYITGFRTCRWSGGNAPRYQRRHPMRVIAYYDAERYITGAMARMLIAGYYVTD